MLKTNKQTTIDCHDWDDFVQKTYGRPYCFQQQDGCKSRGMYHLTVEEEAYDFENDTVPEVVNHEEMGVSFKAWLARDPKQPLPGREDRFGKEPGLLGETMTEINSSRIVTLKDLDFLGSAVLISTSRMF